MNGNEESLNLEEIESNIRITTKHITGLELKHGTMNAEIAQLQKRLAEIQNERRTVNHDIAESKSRLRFMASQREKARQAQMDDHAIAETVKIVEKTFAEYPGWNFPNEKGLTVHDYQKMDVAMNVHAFRMGFSGFMNANDMSLGKTAETWLALKALMNLYMNDTGEMPKVLWLTKTSILRTGGTVREGQTWFPEFKLVEVEGSMPSSQREILFEMINDLGLSVITNYESVRTTENLRQIKWDYIVMDEVHKLKGGANQSGQTGIFKAVKQITNDTKIIMLSGTPMVNRVGEMWAYLNIFDPERFDNLRKFENAYTVYRDAGAEIDADRLLDTALKGRVVRRAKTDPEINLQLPEITPKDQRPVLLEMEPQQRAAYDQMRDQFFIWLDEQDPDSIFTANVIIAQLIRLRQINVWPVIDFHRKDEEGNIVETVKLDIRESSKLDEVMEKIEQVGEQVVMFCTFNEPLFEIQRRCHAEGLTCKVLAGETSKDINTMEVDFQQGKIDVLCVNAAMGEGLNLQKSEQWPGGASYVGLIDKWWNSARDDQCINRVWRQGSTIPVTVWEFENVDSVDQFINDMQATKDQEIKGVAESRKLRPGDWKAALKGKI